MIIHRKGSLFDAPPQSVLVHACNARGVWGAGVAAQMKERFPTAFEAYAAQCRLGMLADPSGRSDEVGRYAIHNSDEYMVVSLITSDKWGSRVDPPESILLATRMALHRLMTIWGSLSGVQFHSPRFNSGLFKVPWTQTEAVLREVVDAYNVNWTVWTP